MNFQIQKINYMNEEIDDIEGLILDYLMGELSEHEIKILQNWVKADKKNKQIFDMFCEIWVVSKASFGNSEYNLEDGFSLFKQKINELEKPIKHKKERLLWSIVRYAAIVFVSLTLGILVQHFVIDKSNKSISDTSYSELVVPYGGNAKYTMIDGTVINLNAGSKLRFETSYGITDRNVTLDGEGYFEVAKNEDLPFNVSTSHITVTAIGTAFNIKAYQNDPIIEATLVEGSVKINNRFNSKKEESIILEPNQMLTFVKNNMEDNDNTDKSLKTNQTNTHNQTAISVDVPLIKINSVNIEPIISWKDNRWIFENEALSSIAIEMERRYDVDINILSMRLGDAKFTGTIINEPIEQVLDAISLVIPIDFEVKGRVVNITEH